jgi:sugar lactone lactonase YvrE
MREIPTDSGTTELMYVTQYGAKLAQYPTGGWGDAAPLCQLFLRSTQGIKTDESGRLYVSDLTGVATFAPNCGNPGPTFEVTNGIADDPAVDGDTLYIANLVDGDQMPPTIGVYSLTGGSQPTAQLSDPSVAKGIGIAVDHHNLFWAATTQLWSGGEVVEFHGGTMPGKVLRAGQIGSDIPGGLLFDKSENLLVVDQKTAAVYIYRPPYDRASHKTIHLKGEGIFCAMSLQQPRLYCLDYQYGSVDAYTYPAGKYLYSFRGDIDAGYGEGIAMQLPSAGSGPRVK